MRPLLLLLVLSLPALAQEPTPLAPGAPVEGALPVGARAYTTYTVEVPAGARRLTVRLEGSGDVDLYVKAGGPILEDFVVEADARSNGPGGHEEVELGAPRTPRLMVGTYYVDVVHGDGPRGAALTYRLVAEVSKEGEGPAAEPMPPGTGRTPPERPDLPTFDADFSTQLTIPAGDVNYKTIRIEVAADVAALELTLRGAPADVDLYARLGEPMEDWTTADARANTEAADETVVLRRGGSPRLRTGTWYVDVARGGDAAVTVTLAAKLTPGWTGGEEPAPAAGRPEPSTTEGVDGLVRGDATWSVSLEDDEKTYRSYEVDVPKGARSLLVSARGAQGDVDLFLRHGKPIEDWRADPDHRAASARSDESLFVDGDSRPPLRPGIYYLDVVRAVEGVDLGAVELDVRFDAPRPAPQPAATGPVEPVVFGERVAVALERRERKTARFGFEVPAGAKRLHVAVLGATRDVDLFVRQGAPVTDYDDPSGHDWKAVSERLAERLVVDADSTPPLRPGTFFLDVASLVSQDEHIAFTLLVTLDDPPALLPGDLRLPPYVHADDTPLERALRATVEVDTEHGHGSGTCVSPSGLVVTNYHVLAHEGKLQQRGVLVSFPDAWDEPPVQAFTARVVAHDEELDLVLLQVDEDALGRPLPAKLDLPFRPVGDPAPLRLGENLWVGGYPAVGGFESRASISLTQGVLAGFTTDGRGRRQWLKTDARINAGNSGGTALRLDPKTAEFVWVGVPTREQIDADDELGFCRPTSSIPDAWRERIRAAGGQAP